MNLHNLMIQLAFLYPGLVPTQTEQLTPFLSRGPDPKVSELQALHDKGFKTIISLRTNPQKKKLDACKKLGMKWINIKTGVFKVPTDEQFDEFRKIVNDPANQPVYTSCEINMDRTQVYLNAWRLTDQHWTPEQIEKDSQSHHQKTWWPIFRKYNRFATAYSKKVAQGTSTTASSATLSTSAHVSERAATDSDVRKD